MPGRPEDRKRILRLLNDTEGLSNNRIKTELTLTDDRCDAVELINEGLVEKLQMRGGGIRLTRKGEKQSAPEQEVSSGAENESGLYKHFEAFLEAQADQDGIQAVVCPTHQLKARGKWRNPDVTRIAIDFYRNLRKVDVTVTTYEVKQFPNWNVSAVYEAASHHRFSHEECTTDARCSTAPRSATAMSARCDLSAAPGTRRARFPETFTRMLAMSLGER
jgi:hypothetical protein